MKGIFESICKVLENYCWSILGIVVMPTDFSIWRCSKDGAHFRNRVTTMLFPGVGLLFYVPSVRNEAVWNLVVQLGGVFNKKLADVSAAIDNDDKLAQLTMLRFTYKNPHIDHTNLALNALGHVEENGSVLFARPWNNFDKA